MPIHETRLQSGITRNAERSTWAIFETAHPTDFYSLKLLDKIKNLPCPICGSYHESKAAVGRHRRAVYKYVRAGDSPMPTVLEVEELDLEKAELIIDQKRHLYLVLFEDGDAG